MSTTDDHLAEPIHQIRWIDFLLKMISGLCSLLLLGGFFFCAPAKAADVAQRFIPGVYEGLMLAVNQEGKILGFYREVQGDGPTKICSFFLKGQDAGEQASMVTWNKEIFPGLLKIDGNNVILKIERGREHPGCGLVMLPEIATGITLSRVSAAQWIGLKIIEHDRAPLFSEPSENKKTKSYFIKNDVVGVVSGSGEWLKVEFPREGKKPIKGWIKSSDARDFLLPTK